MLPPSQLRIVVSIVLLFNYLVYVYMCVFNVQHREIIEQLKGANVLLLLWDPGIIRRASGFPTQPFQELLR